MPLTDKQLTAAARWLDPGDGDFREHIDFLWDGLTGAQQTGLIARIKSDLNTDLDEDQARLDVQRDKVNEV
jgi:hypothetical protein